MSIALQILVAVLAMGLGIACMLPADASGKRSVIDDVRLVQLGVFELVVGACTVVIITGLQDALPAIMMSTVSTVAGALTFGFVWLKARKALGDLDMLLVQASLFTNVACAALVVNHRYHAPILGAIAGMAFILAVSRVLFGLAVLGIEHILARQESGEQEDPPN
jgi:hypothetical protein